MQVRKTDKIRFVSFGLAVLAGALILMYSIGCYSSRKAEEEDEVAIVLDWNKFLLVAEMHTEGYRGPVASRAYGLSLIHIWNVSAVIIMVVGPKTKTIR